MNNAADKKNKERVKGPWAGFLGVIKVTFLASGLAALLSIIQDKYYESPAELRLKEEITEMEALFRDLDQRIVSLQEVVSNIEHRDDHLYRQVLGVEPLDHSFRKGGIGGAQRYINIRDARITQLASVPNQTMGN